MNRLKRMARCCYKRYLRKKEEARGVEIHGYEDQEKVALMYIEARVYLGRSVEYLGIISAIRYQRNVE